MCRSLRKFDAFFIYYEECTGDKVSVLNAVKIIEIETTKIITVIESVWFYNEIIMCRKNVNVEEMANSFAPYCTVPLVAV